MLRIRLTRKGAKKAPHYRVVVAERENPRDGRFVEEVGHFCPLDRCERLQIKLDRVDHWIARGAQPTRTVQALIRRARQAEGTAVVGEPTVSAEPEA